MLRTDIINLLIKKINAKKYLEIGVSNGINLSQIECDYKIGVDPDFNSPADIYLTSDDFFDKNKETFDVVFIDGLHHYEQVYKDILNSLNVLNDGGYIVCHDMNPWQEDIQTIPYNPQIHTLWTGDCWKAFVRLRRERSDLEMYVVDTDCGCGIIKKGNQKCLEGNEGLNWSNLEKNRQEWLNLISKEKFIEKLYSTTFNTDDQFMSSLQGTVATIDPYLLKKEAIDEYRIDNIEERLTRIENKIDLLITKLKIEFYKKNDWR